MNAVPASAASALHFQRPAGRIRVKKPVRRVALRFRHILFLFGGAALFFFTAYEVYSFVIAWPYLDVKSVRVECSDPAVRALVRESVGSARWGNLILLDLDRTRRDIEAIPWVKEARTRKVFPSALDIEVVPRRSAAILELGSLFLLDEGGTVIEQAGRAALPELPLIVDDGKFIRDAAEKIRLAFACLNDLPADVRTRVDILDLTDLSDVVLRFRDSRTRLHLGDGLFATRVSDYLERKDAWERESGELDYVILWFEDRIVIRPFPNQRAADEAPAAPVKEAR